jgi:hypothetical protein
LSKKTIARQQLASTAVENGISPLQLMLKRMRYYNQVADRELEKGSKADQDKIDQALRSASDAARDAAPYIHPRLSAVEHAHGGEVNLLHELFKVIDGTGRGLPDPAKVRPVLEYQGATGIPAPQATVTLPAAAAGAMIVIEAKAEAVTVEQPKTKTLVMPARPKSLLPDPERVVPSLHPLETDGTSRGLPGSARLQTRDLDVLSAGTTTSSATLPVALRVPEAGSRMKSLLPERPSSVTSTFRVRGRAREATGSVPVGQDCKSSKSYRVNALTLLGRRRLGSNWAALLKVHHSNGTRRCDLSGIFARTSFEPSGTNTAIVRSSRS